MFGQLINLSKELTDQELKDILLDEGWRISKVGAWMIGLDNRKILKLNLEECLRSNVSENCEHILLSYYALEKEESAGILLSFLENQTKNFIKSTHNDYEHLSIDWVRAVLRLIDGLYNKNYTAAVESSEWWNDFISHIAKNKLFAENLQSEFYYEKVKEAVNRIESL